MTQVIDLASDFVDHFPVFESDGYTKKTGESSFTITVWKEAVVTAVTASIAEIGATGEYALTITPTSAGEWSAEVIVAYNNSVFGAEFNVRKADIQMSFSAADDETTTRFSVWAERDGERLLDLDSIAAVIRSADGTQIADLGTDATDTGDGVFSFSVSSASIPEGYEYYLDATATRGTLSWRNNLGFAKVV